MTASFRLAASRSDTPQSAHTAQSEKCKSPKTRDAPLLGAEASQRPEASPWQRTRPLTLEKTVARRFSASSV